MGVEEEIRQFALDRGALVVGIASVEAVSAYAPEGHRPADVLPRARSLVVVGGRIPTAAALASPDWHAAGISRVSRESALTGAAHALEDLLEGKYGYYAIHLSGSLRGGMDTNPFISMKLCAEEAGLGLRGLSSVVINPQYGPHLSFETVATTMPLRADGRLARNPCPHPECIRRWKREGTTNCLEACPDCLSGELERGRIKWSRYEQSKCWPRSEGSGYQRFTQMLELILAEENSDRRRMMMYGTDFQRCIRAIAGGLELYATCYECQTACPIGREHLKLK